MSHAALRNDPPNANEINKGDLFPMTTKKPFQAALSVATALTLVACVSPTPYAKQSLATANMLTPQQIAAQYQIDTIWWHRYQDPQLNRLVATTLANNIDLKKAAITVEKARYSAHEAGAALLPLNSSSGSLTRTTNKNLAEGGARQNSFSSSVGIGLSYELDLWQKVRASANAAEWEYHATEQDMAASRLALINSVVDAYFHLAYMDEAIELTEKSITQYREIARISTSQYRLGKVASINPTNANQSLLGAQGSLLALQQNRDQIEQNLRNLLNLRPDQALDVQPARLASVPPTEVDLNVPLSVLANRPDLQAAEHRLQNAWSGQQAAQRSWYPSITLNAAISASSSNSSSLFSVPLGVGSVGVSLPFLDWQTLHWRNQQAKASFEMAKLDFDKALTTALNEVDGYYRQYQSSREVLAKDEQKYGYDQKNSHYHQLRYQHGAESLSDWLGALNGELSSAQSVLNSRYTVLQNETRIYQSMAGRYSRKTE